MNAYLASVLENVKTKHGNEPEFVQTVEEVLSSLEPVIEKHPEYEKVDLLGRMVEPERMFTFRVVWDLIVLNLLFLYLCNHCFHHRNYFFAFF